MRSFVRMIAAVVVLPFCIHYAKADSPSETRSPNIVIVFCDDLGYADIGCFGAKAYETPNIDRAAQEGIRFTDFYVPHAVCSASRAALLTGCYSNRIGIYAALMPTSKVGLHENEVTIAEILKPRGYATAIFGKWHLGHHQQFLPIHHGFDEYFGLPYSNDMWPKHPTAKNAFPPLPLIEGDKVVQEMPDQSQLTTWYTERAVDFIGRHKDQPFFVYVPHSMPHVPLFVSDKFKGKSKQGLFGDVIMEIDWSVGQILAALKANGVDNNTLFIFTSDNGPWLAYGNHAGSAQPLREGKGTEFDGGVRVPCVMRWPGHIPAGSVCKEPAMTIDLLPTIAKLTGSKLPEHKIDGLDIWPLISVESNAKSPHDALLFYWDRHLQAIRRGRWKLHFPHNYRSLTGAPGSDGIPDGYSQGTIGMALFDLENDLSETNNVIDQHPEIVAELSALADRAREDLGDSAKQLPGKGVRSAGVFGEKK